MAKINFLKAYYIKLGRGNIWAEDSINNNKIRIGWKNQTIDDIKNANWDKIKEELFSELKNKSTTTRDLNALKNIVSNDDKIFISFFDSKMYWCKPKKGTINSDTISKYILVDGKWNCTDITGMTTFYINQISGKLSKYQGFRATCCIVGNQYDENNYLKRLINNEESDEYLLMIKHKNSLREILEKQIQQLHPKDFEILIDLIFRQAGWKRHSVLGETMEFFDLILEEVISNSLYGVQVKTKSSKNEFIKYSKEFNEKYSTKFNKFLFIVHTPDLSYTKYQNDFDNVELWNTKKLPELTIELGLLNWILKIIR